MSVKQALMTTTAANRINLVGVPTLLNFKISESVPSGTATRYLVKRNDSSWQKYDTANKKWVDVATQALTPASVMSQGNTATQLNAVPRSAMAVFVNKQVDVAAALQTNSNTLPTITSFTINGGNFAKNSVPCGSPIVLNAETPVSIVDISVDKTEVGSGKCTVLASIQDASGAWSAYKEYHEYLKTDTFAKAIKFCANYSVQNIGPDSAKVDSVSVTYRTGRTKGNAIAVCTTKSFTFPHKISGVHMIVKHPDARDATIQPKVSFKNAAADKETWIPLAKDTVKTDSATGLLSAEFDYSASEAQAGSIVTLRVDMVGNTGSVKNQALGAGTGAVTSYKLDHRAIQNTIVVSPADATWTYNSKNCSIDITAKAGSAVTISYDWEAEATYLDSMSCIFNE